MSTFRVLVVVTGLVVLGVSASALDDLVRHGGARGYFGWTEAPTPPPPSAFRVVESVDPSGPAAGRLQPGDRLVSLDGDTLVARFGTAYVRTTEPVGWRYSIRILRGGQELEYQLSSVAGRRRLAYPWSMFFTSLVWCAVGLFIGFAKPDDGVARVAFAAAVATGLVFLQSGATPQHLPGGIHQPLHFALGYHFFFRFPGGIDRGKVSRTLLWAFYVVAAFTFVVRQPLTWLYYTQGPGATAAWAAEHAALLKWSWALALALMVPVVTAALVLLASTYSRVTDRQKRRRIRWIVFTGAVGLSPQLLWAVLAFVRHLYAPEPSPIPGGLWRGATLAAGAGTVVIPLGVAYAVVRHRVFDIAVVIRRGVQYLLARRALQLLLALPATALVLTAVVHRDRTIGELVGQNAGYLWLIVAMGLSLRHRESLSRWLDRRFFRQQYDRERVLAGLLADLGRLTRPGDVSPLVMAQVDYALHPNEVHVWFEGDANPPPEALLTRIAEKGAGPDVPLTGDPDLPEGMCLAVPLGVSDERVSGVLMLSEKRSEEPYSTQDLSLLSMVAKQAAMVRENLLLREDISEERRIRTDVLAHLGPERVNLVKECPVCGLCYDSTEERCSRDQEKLGLFLPFPRMVAGRYRLDARIGQGGMGTVYEAMDGRLHRTVAIKFLLGSAMGRAQGLRRFRREARAVARVDHPNIVRVYDHGDLEPHGAYLVMERIRGVTLREELRARGPLSGAAAAEWFGPLLDGIAAAHSEGIIHRDLKPDNVVRVRGDESPDLVKILDFGVAKVRPADTTGDYLTATGAVVGTLGYQAPEQLRGLDVDARADFFALGVMVVEALTGRWPFSGESYSELLAAIVLEPFHLPGDDPGILALDRVLQRCLAKDPGDRYASATDVREALVPALRGCPEFVS